MKTKTASLSGAALDWAVIAAIYPGISTGSFWFDFVKANSHSSSWDLSGPIIEREKIDITCDPGGGWHSRIYPTPLPTKHPFMEEGPTPLVAAMRCYCASRLGDEVEVPEELL